ncbi:MAG: hypothetical protein JXR73_20595, partial [Candidatus Omnitrophica bacterium]|nr:hypothetical protein [Candidatus Omnitrophota bacterium]
MRTMRNATLLIAGLLGVLMAAPQTWAQEDNDAAAKIEKQIETQVERMTKRFDLNDEQQKQIEDIMTSSMNDIEELHKQIQKCRESLREKIDKVLTEEQKSNRSDLRRGPREGRGPQADQPWQGRGFGRGDRGQGGPA